MVPARVTFSKILMAVCLCACQASMARPSLRTSSPNLGIPPEIQHLWASSAPYFTSGTYSAPPSGCKINQVNILQRHGARFPTSGNGAQLQASVSKLQSVNTSFRDPKLEFLKTFVYDLGTDVLVPFGALQSFQAGEEAFSRYGKLVKANDLPFVRASSSSRVVDSATNWTAGFAAASRGFLQPKLSVILQESLNDTLDDNMCPNAGSGDAETNAWQAIYAQSVANSLNKEAPGANLSVGDTTNLIGICPFETVAKEKPSQFCDLFNITAFEGFEYLGDLSKFYGTGYGQALGPIQGVGYINELLARLTATPVQDHTQTNHTLDSSMATFPLNRTLYADFSHDNQMAAIFAAMGLFRPLTPLDPTNPNPGRVWVTSKMVPFSGRLVTERLDCRGEQFVRMLVNDALQDLTFCGANKEGLCSVDAFVRSQGFARGNGDEEFGLCFN